MVLVRVPMEIEIIVKWKIKESETARILAMLPELADRSKCEKGNVFYTIYRSKNDPHEFILHELYTDADAFEAHKTSEYYQRIVVGEIIPHLVLREVTFVNKLL